MRILAIETSCDETAVAVVESSGTFPDISFRVLASALYSQVSVHKEFGGVFPAVAKREHAAHIVPLLEEALGQAEMLRTEYRSLTKERQKFSELFSHEPGLADAVCMFLSRIATPDIQAITVTAGPGLEPTLWVGINTAKALGQYWDIPVIPGNHMEGHFLSSLVRDGKIEGIQLPVLGLLISGGHTELALMKEWLSYEVIGSTLDDAVGEAFDKVARLLDLPYPGGPQISKLAEEARAQNIESTFTLPRPMHASGDLHFSFSGLKTAVLYTVQKIEQMTDEHRLMLAREFEDAVADVFVTKVRTALVSTGAKNFLIGGGVAANTHIRRELEKIVREEFPGVTLYLPHPSLTGDNAVMMAQCALMHIESGDMPKGGDIRADGNLSLSPEVQKQGFF